MNTRNAMNVYRMGALAEPIFAYANSGCWDPCTHQMLFGGSPHCYKPQLAVYRESDNNWRIENMWVSMPCHAYDQQTIDTAGIYYWMNYGAGAAYRFDTRANVWISPLPGSYGDFGSLDYFPEINGLVHTNGGTVCLYPLDQGDKGSWRTLAEGLSCGGYHNIAQYCPAGRMILFGGGVGNERVIYKLDTALHITSLRPAPFNLGVASGSLITADPVTGQIIVIQMDSLYGYNERDDTWHGIVACPYSVSTYLGGHVGVIPISTYGVIAILSTSSYPVLLYKNAEMTDVEKGRSAAGLPLFQVNTAPNPFHTASRVEISIPVRESVNLSVHDMAGRLVRQMADGTLEAGPHHYSWDASDEKGRPVPAGIYIVRMQAGATVSVKKLIREK